jgi:hypothetical protein
MSSPVSAQSVRLLAKSLRANVAPEIKHQSMLEIVANSLGWKGSALLGLLNKAESLPVTLCQADVDPAIVLDLLVQGNLLEAYLAARHWKVQSEIECLIKAVALYEFEPNAAISLGRKAIHTNVKLTLALLATSGGGPGLLDAKEWLASDDRAYHNGRDGSLFHNLALSAVANKMPLVSAILGTNRVKLMVASLKADKTKQTSEPN